MTDSYIPGERLFTSQERAELKRLFDSVPDRDTLVHGDFHTHNIFSQDGELLLIDMADTSTGHPLFELGDMYFVFVMIGQSSSDRVLQLTGLQSDKAVYFCNKVCEFFLPGFTAEDMNVLRHVCEVLGTIRMMIVAVASSALNAFPVDVRRRSLLGMKERLKNLCLDRSDSVIEDIKRLTEKF